MCNRAGGNAEGVSVGSATLQQHSFFVADFHRCYKQFSFVAFWFSNGYLKKGNSNGAKRAKQSETSDNKNQTKNSRFRNAKKSENMKRKIVKWQYCVSSHFIVMR